MPFLLVYILFRRFAAAAHLHCRLCPNSSNLLRTRKYLVCKFWRTLCTYFQSLFYVLVPLRAQSQTQAPHSKHDRTPHMIGQKRPSLLYLVSALQCCAARLPSLGLDFGDVLLAFAAKVCSRSHAQLPISKS